MIFQPEPIPSLQQLALLLQYPNSNKYSRHQSMSNNLKLQLYRITLTIHEINISVKFPCSVATSLKADAKQTQIPKDFKLLSGNAKVQQSVTTNLKIMYNPRNKLFTETKVCVLVYLKSSSGRIPAGSATIPIKSDRQHQQAKVGIEKCPDKTANILYSLKLVKENQEDYFEQNTFHSRSTLNLGEQVNNMPITITEIRQSEPKLGIKKHLKSQIFNSRAKSNFLQDDRSQREHSEAGSQSQSRISKLIMKQHENEVSSQRQKILELEKEKVKAMKEIRALKHEIETNSLKNSTISEFQDQNLIAKHETRIDNLQDQLEKERNKASEFQSEAHKRKLRIQEIQKDLKISQKKNEQMQQQLKRQVAEKQSLSAKNKEIAFELRQIREKYEDILLAHENYVKRAEFKQAAYKQQLKTINDKYTASESQKQKLLFQKNEIISENEEKDKKQKDNYRNRERMMIEQKNKLLRKIDSLQKQIISKQEQKQHFDEFVAQLESANRKNKTALENKQAQIQDLQSQISTLKASLEKQINFRKSLENQLLKTDKLDEQRKNFKKAIAQKQQQIAQLSKTKSNLEMAKKTVYEKSQQLQAQLKQRSMALKTLQKQFENLSKKYEIVRKSEEQKSKQLNDITFMKQNEETKVYGLNEELKEMEKKSKIKEFQMGKQIENLNNRIYELEEQNHQAAEKCFVFEQQVYDLDKNLNELKNAYQFKLSQADNLQSKLEESYSSYEKLLGQIQEAKIKKAELEQSLQARIDKLSKKVKQQENQNRQLQIKLEVNSKNQDQSYTKISSQLKTYQMEAKSKDKQIYELKRLADENQAQIVSLTTENQHTTLQSRQRLKEIQMLKDTVQILKQQNHQLEEKLKQAEFQLQTCKNETKLMQENLMINGKQKQEASNQIKKAKKQLQKFKSTNQYFLKTFFNLMTQPDVPQVINVSHDDPEIVKSMMQVLKKKKAIKIQYNKNVEELNSFNDDLKAQIESLNNQVAIRNQDIENLSKTIEQISKEKELFEKSALKEKNSLEKKISQKDNIIEDLQKHIQDLENGGTNLSSIIQQKQSQIQELSEQLSKTKKIIEGLQQKIETTTLESNREIKKILQNTNFSIGQLKAQLQVLKIKLQTEEAKRKMITITNEQHLSQIDQMKEELADAEREKAVLSETIVRLQKQIKEAYELIDNKDHQLAQFEANHNSVLSELEFSNSQYRELNQRIINLQIVKKQLQQKVEKTEAKNRDLTETLKQKQKFYEEQTRRFEAQSKKMGKQLQNEKKAKGNFQSKGKQFQDKLSTLQSQLAQSNKEVDNLRKKINVITNENAGERQKYNKQQENTIKKYAQTIEQKQKLIEQYESQIEQMKAEREFLENNISNLEKGMQQAQQQNKRASEQTNKKLSELQKQNGSLAQELGSTKQQLKSVQANLTELSRNFENYQLQNNNQVEYLQPISDKLSRLLEDTDEYVRFMNQFEASKAKLLKISSYKLQNYGSKTVGEIVRQINVAAQRCKLQILNKSKIPQEDKIGIVEEFKTLQASIEKVARF